MLLPSTVSVHNNVQQFVLKLRINEQNLGIHIINPYPDFEMIKKCTGCADSTRLLSSIHPQGSNGMSMMFLIIVENFLPQLIRELFYY